jgi:2-phosphosulfolactate phosphatase
MQIEILDFVAGARAARGVAVVIDVFRAFSVACYAFAGGVQRVLPMSDLEASLALKRANPDYLAIGERNGKRVPGFDFNNSPTEIRAASLEGRTLVHNTSAGTQGLTNASRAAVVLTGSLVNAAAICRYIKSLAPQQVSIVRMGYDAHTRSAEDDLCAELLAARLQGEPFDVASVRARLRHVPAAVKFFDPACADWAPRTDFDLCTDVDRFDFVLRLLEDGAGVKYLERIDA